MPPHRPHEPSSSEPDAGWDEIDRRVRDDVARRGFHLGLVPPEAGTPGWAFTIGLAERFDHAELVGFAPDLELVGALVERLAARVRAGERFAADTEIAGVLRDHAVALRAVAPKWIPAFLGNAAWHRGERALRALQCFWPDRAGRYPWQPDFDAEWRDDQPLLYHAETHRALAEPMIGVLRREGAL